MCLLPVDPDRSAEADPVALVARTGVKSLAVLVTDTFGRPWREGQVDNVAIGVAGMAPIPDHPRTRRPERTKAAWSARSPSPTIAGAAELVMGKLDRVPVALVRGYPFEPGEGGCAVFSATAEQDIFR